METCLDSNIRTGLDMLGKQGGYIEFPENFPFQETSGTYIPLHYDEGDDNLPSLEDMQNSLAGYINQGVFVCLNDFLFFKEKGIEFSAAVMTTEVIISESAVNIQLNYPVTITDKGGNIFKLASFNKNTPIKLKKMHEFAELVILAVKDYDESFEFFPDFIPNIQYYISYLAPELYLDPLPVPTSSHLFLWQIKGTAGNEEFNFIFGTKTSREMPH